MYKHLTSIKKRQEEKTAHTHRKEHLREMTRRGQHSTPKKHKRVERTGQSKKKEGGGEEKNDNTVSQVKFGARCMSWSCRTVQHHRHLCWTTARWEERESVCVEGGGRGGGRRGSGQGQSTACPDRLRCAALDIFCVRWSWDYSVLCCAGLH